ncbi:hypothetical protein VTK56DRAFT_9470 [Thermocarpiscus australiensis]
MNSLPTPPHEEPLKPQGPKKSHSIPKSVKTVHRPIKRSSTHGHPPSPATDSHVHSSDGRHKRVWKACERCRMKKTKCDGEFPCKRCKDDGLVCTAGTRKKTEYKQLPRGYAEVLENTQFALIATVHKLYSMVRNQEPWELGEPELNDRGQPVIHNIASKLGCIRPNSDMDLPVHSVFPEDEAGLAELARQLEEQQQKDGGMGSQNFTTSSNHQGQDRHDTESPCNRTDRASSSAASDLDHSDFEPDFSPQAAFGSASVATLSPASLSYTDFDLPPQPAAPSEAAFQHHSPTGSTTTTTIPTTSFSSWLSRPTSMDFSSSSNNNNNNSGCAQQPPPPYIAAAGSGPSSYLDTTMDAADMLVAQGQLLLESSYGGAIKPHVLSSCATDPTGVMLGLGDPMIYAGYEGEPLPL